MSEFDHIDKIDTLKSTLKLLSRLILETETETEFKEEPTLNLLILKHLENNSLNISEADKAEVLKLEFLDSDLKHIIRNFPVHSQLESWLIDRIAQATIDLNNLRY